jgi:hypothetical protein
MHVATIMPAKNVAPGLQTALTLLPVAVDWHDNVLMLLIDSFANGGDRPFATPVVPVCWQCLAVRGAAAQGD